MKKPLMMLVGAVAAMAVWADNPVRGLPDPDDPQLDEEQPFTGVIAPTSNTTTYPPLQYYFDDPNVYSMGFGGNNMWAGSEGYSYVYLQSVATEFELSGDLEICGDATELNCGFMVRTSPDVNARCLCFNYRRSGANRFWNVNGRTTDGGLIDNVILGDGSLAGNDQYCQLRMVRDGDTLSFYCRESDDDEWSSFGVYNSANALLGETYYLGLYVTGGAAGWANFRNVRYAYDKGEFSPPGFVRVTAGTNDAVVVWGEADGAVAYQVERMAYGEAEWTPISGLLGADVFRFADTTAPRNGKACSYRVVSFGDEDRRATSEIATGYFFDWANGTGLLARYYDIAGGTNTLVESRVERTLNFPWNQNGGGPVDGLTKNFRAEFFGKLIAPVDGDYVFHWFTDENLLVAIDDVTYDFCQMESSKTVYLDAGAHDIRILYWHDAGPDAWLGIKWKLDGYLEEDFVQTSQMVPAGESTIHDVTEAGWNGWCVRGDQAKATVDYDPASGMYEVCYRTKDMWDTVENYVYIWRHARKESFDLVFKLDNQALHVNHKLGAMIRRDVDLGAPCLTFNHRRSDDGSLYFVDVNGRQSAAEGTGISDHKTGVTVAEDRWISDPEVGQSVYMKVSRRSSTYTFSIRRPGETDWVLFDTFVDEENMLGSRPVVGLTAFECNCGQLDKGFFSEVSFAEGSMGTVVLVR